MACSRCDLGQVCLNCDGPKGPLHCNVAQNYCGPQAESASAWISGANAPAIVQDDIIIKKLPQAELNRLINWLSGAMSYMGVGPGSSPAGGGASAPSTEGRQFVYADKIQEIITALTAINAGNNPGVSPGVDQVIYANDFNKIMEVFNSLKFSPSACPQCVDGCNMICDTCNRCDTCQGCDYCNTCEGCDYCDYCEYDD